jgi:hypothetical protein
MIGIPSHESTSHTCFFEKVCEVRRRLLRRTEDQGGSSVSGFRYIGRYHEIHERLGPGEFSPGEAPSETAVRPQHLTFVGVHQFRCLLVKTVDCSDHRYYLDWRKAGVSGHPNCGGQDLQMLLEQIVDGYVNYEAIVHPYKRTSVSSRHCCGKANDGDFVTVIETAWLVSAGSLKSD